MIDNTVLTTVAHPDTPEITEECLREIYNFNIINLGGGVIVFRNTFTFNQKKIFEYIDGKADYFHENRWDYIVGEDGLQYGVNEDGFRYKLDEIPTTPVRVLRPIDDQTPEEAKTFFNNLEDQIYKCLIRYIDLYPLILGCIWWRTRGHVLRYIDQGILGSHCDNDTNYKVTQGVRYMPRGQMAAQQTCGALVYLNDCVDNENELDGTNFIGGHLRFFHLGIEYKPKKGDIVFFPTNYMASHDVTRMTDGIRYSYLTFFGQGSSHPEVGLNIVEPEESFDWCPPMWLNHIYDDYEKYCRSEYSIYSSKEAEHGINPVFQGRCVAQYQTTHSAEKI